jgi:hypothetical protein
MKEITTYGDQYGKCYEIKGDDGYTETFVDYQSALDYLSFYHNIDYAFNDGKTLKERIDRLKSERRNNRIDELLNDTK